MKIKDSYDWIVLGESNGALLSACMAARLGLSVLVLPLGLEVKTIISESGQCLDPEPNFILGLGKFERHSGILADCLTRLGATASELDRIQRHGVFPQMLTSGKRVFFSPDAESVEREFAREFGQDFIEHLGLTKAAEAIQNEVMKFWREFPDLFSIVERLEYKKDPKVAGKKSRSKTPISFLDLKRSFGSLRTSLPSEARAWTHLGRELSDLFKSTHVNGWRDTAEALWYGLMSIDTSQIKLADFLHSWIVGRSGAAYRGGQTAYREYLIRLASRLGATVPEGIECKSLFLEDRKFRGIQIAQHGQMVSAGGGIIGCSMDHLIDKLSTSGNKKQNAHTLLKPAPKAAGWRFTIALTVGADAFPPGVSNHLIWKEESAPVLEIEIANPEDYGAGKAENRLVFLRTVLPFTQESLDPTYQRVIASRVLRQFSEIFPFATNHIVRVFPDFRSGTSQLTQSFGFTSPEMIPENLRLYTQKGISNSTGIEGLFVATCESYPELGTLGPTVAAMESVAWLAHRNGLPSPLV